MAIHQEAPPDARPRLKAAATVARLTLIGVALVVVAGTFAYLGGWLTPNALTFARFNLKAISRGSLRFARSATPGCASAETVKRS